ncbi:MAG: hypothetical protein U5L96_09075 [Owenweeksia sp.]|nr:hypothetical protein [Owenweeksia sp.]
MPSNSCAPVSFGPIHLSTGRNLQYQWSVYPGINITNPNGRNPVFHFPRSSDSVDYTIRVLVTG